MSDFVPAANHFWARPGAAAPGGTASPASYGAAHLATPAPPFVPPGAAQPPPPSTPVSVFSSAPPRGEPMRLYRDKREEERNADKYEDMSAVFSVITATERLENIWARWGAISQDDYERQCELLIQQYKVLRMSTQAFIPKIDKFIHEYDIKASKARFRLECGYPVTVVGSKEPKHQNKFVFRCTSLFHHLGTCIDTNQVAVGFLLPDLISLMKTLKSISVLPQDFEFHARVVHWVEKLNAMPPAVELSMDDASQLKLDLDNGYAELEAAISN